MITKIQIVVTDTEDGNVDSRAYLPEGDPIMILRDGGEEFHVGQVSSSIGWAKLDMRNHFVKEFDAYYPGGWELEFRYDSEGVTPVAAGFAKEWPVGTILHNEDFAHQGTFTLSETEVSWSFTVGSYTYTLKPMPSITAYELYNIGVWQDWAKGNPLVKAERLLEKARDLAILRHFKQS